mmetsp:Transcript_22405/g.70294  ORF Transcript_22405/g.70294 Transcript_22405/m.70294 type:complete len:236 (+) Transcript_22405:451-1158(+)
MFVDPASLQLAQCSLGGAGRLELAGPLADKPLVRTQLQLQPLDPARDAEEVLQLLSVHRVVHVHEEHDPPRPGRHVVVSAPTAAARLSRVPVPARVLVELHAERAPRFARKRSVFQLLYGPTGVLGVGVLAEAMACGAAVPVAVEPQGDNLPDPLERGHQVLLGQVKADVVEEDDALPLAAALAAAVAPRAPRVLRRVPRAAPRRLRRRRRRRGRGRRWCRRIRRRWIRCRRWRG